ncbi:hypothetical protein [Hutsoniella sourekii]|uniref:hypothetical protein n=1 Tax=Hutsoniella sourekii TaxID=87650 RepID=UPI000487EB50|nr:hypothetical protein [Hutsoniella sourekii]
MKLTELQVILGEQTKQLHKMQDTVTPIDIDRANAISGLARQMIQNANVILKAEKQNSSKKDELI